MSVHLQTAQTLLSQMTRAEKALLLQAGFKLHLRGWAA